MRMMSQILKKHFYFFQVEWVLLYGSASEVTGIDYPFFEWNGLFIPYIQGYVLMGKKSPLLPLLLCTSSLAAVKWRRDPSRAQHYKWAACLI